jgi:GT2 family glycosyltransferase
VIDDASPGNIISQTARRFAGVKVHRLEKQSGFCVAANHGISLANGEIIEILNDDTEVSAGWAGAVLGRFTKGVAAVTPLVLMGPPGTFQPERVDSAGDHYHVAGVARKRGHGEALTPRHLVARSVQAANGSGSFFRREVLLAVGGFPEEFVAYFDDVDLSLRLRRAGWDILYEPASRIHHRISSSYGRPAGELLALQSRNEELVYWRNLPLPVLLAALPLHAIVVGAKAIKRWRQRELLPFLVGRWQALRMWREVLRHRAQPLPTEQSAPSISPSCPRWRFGL